jgi:hypothetical protein
MNNTKPNESVTMAEEAVVTSVVRTHDPDVQYDERYHPCFLWTLILCPCLLPFVWYVSSS